MLTVSFDRTEQIRSQADLIARFGLGRAGLAAGAQVELYGEVTLADGVVFSGRCRLAGPIRIDAGSLLTNVTLGAGTVVRAYSILTNATAGDRNVFGPFCYIRDECVIGDDCILGAHVEATRSRFGNGVKISHRAFVGDAVVGDGTIIGAGVVFCNFDGHGRQPTKVGSRVTIGSGSLLVAPVTIGDDSLIGAGSTVTKNIAVGTKLIQKRHPVPRDPK